MLSDNKSQHIEIVQGSYLCSASHAFAVGRLARWPRPQHRAEASVSECLTWRLQYALAFVRVFYPAALSKREHHAWCCRGCPRGSRLCRGGIPRLSAKRCSGRLDL